MNFTMESLNILYIILVFDRYLNLVEWWSAMIKECSEVFKADIPIGQYSCPYQGVPARTKQRHMWRHEKIYKQSQQSVSPSISNPSKELNCLYEIPSIHNKCYGFLEIPMIYPVETNKQTKKYLSNWIIFKELQF